MKTSAPLGIQKKLAKRKAKGNPRFPKKRNGDFLPKGHGEKSFEARVSYGDRKIASQNHIFTSQNYFLTVTVMSQRTFYGCIGFSAGATE